VGVRSEVFGAQQGDEHVDRHSGGRGDVENGDKHSLHPPQEDGVDRKQREHGRADGDEDEIHWDRLRFLEPLMYRLTASTIGAYEQARA
jgi:hypothetical protein